MLLINYNDNENVKRLGGEVGETNQEIAGSITTTVSISQVEFNVRSFRVKCFKIKDGIRSAVLLINFS